MRAATRRACFATLAATLAALAACSDEVTAPAPPPAGPAPLGLVEVKIEGIGSPSMSASAHVHGSRAAGPRLSLGRAANQDGSGDGTLQLELISAGQFTEGTRGEGGTRYVFAAFRVRNAQQDGTAYDTPRHNPTFLAVATPRTLHETAVSEIFLSDGSPAPASLAVQILPSGGLTPDLGTGGTSSVPDVLQVLSEEEVAGIAAPPQVRSILPYGFVVRNPNSATSRDLPASPPPDQWDGVVTFAFRLPLQQTTRADPTRLAVLFLAVDDPVTRITQSREEQTPAGAAALDARAAAIGASTVTLLPGGAYAGPVSVRTLCGVRTAGSREAPSAALVHCPGLKVDPSRVWIPVGMSTTLTVTLVGADGDVVPSPVATFGSSDPSVAVVDAAGLTTGAGEGTATLTVTAGGYADTVQITGIALRKETITAGGSHTCGLTAAGGAYCWGYNAYGQLGDGGTTHRLTPVPVAGGHAFTRISAGAHHTVALTAAGQAYAWGLNHSGQLGDGSTTDRHAPVAVAGGLAFAQVSAGAHHTVARTAAGQAYAWGHNYDGRLGDGSTTRRATPVPVAGGHLFTHVDAGAYHTVALTAAGQAYAWGSNEYGQLGDDGTTDRHTPVLVAGGHAFAQVGAGAYHTVALTGMGQAYAWGSNASGQLGDGSTTDSHTPVPVAGGHGFAQLGAGDLHTVALTAGGQAYAWGSNAHGQLGDAGTTDRPAPVSVAGGHAFTRISAGARHTVALGATGQARAWGSNHAGRLGDGGTTDRLVPTPVSGALPFAEP